MNSSRFLSLYFLSLLKASTFRHNEPAVNDTPQLLRTSLSYSCISSTVVTAALFTKSVKSSQQV